MAKKKKWPRKTAEEIAAAASTIRYVEDSWVGRIPYPSADTPVWFWLGQYRFPKMINEKRRADNG